MIIQFIFQSNELVISMHFASQISAKCKFQFFKKNVIMFQFAFPNIHIEPKIKCIINFNLFTFICSYLKAALLPNSQQSLRTSLASGALLKPVFGNLFSVPIPLNKLYTKTLQVNVFSVVGQREEIVVSVNFFWFFFLAFL